MTMRKHVDTSAQVAMIREAARLACDINGMEPSEHGEECAAAHAAIAVLKRVLTSINYMSAEQFDIAIDLIASELQKEEELS